MQDAGCRGEGARARRLEARGLWPLDARRTRVGMGALQARQGGQGGQGSQGRVVNQSCPQGLRKPSLCFVVEQRSLHSLRILAAVAAGPMHTQSHHVVASARRVRVPCPDPESSPRACAACRLMFRVLPRDLLISTSSCTMYHVPGRSNLRCGLERARALGGGR